VEFGDLKVVLRGHHDLIHDLHWSPDDSYLVSASADGSAKVYDLSLIDKNVPDRLNYTENDKYFFVCQLLHPSFVYSAKFYPDVKQTSTHLIIATACFDQKVRLWTVATDGSSIGQNLSAELEVSIIEKPLKTLGAKHSIYELDQLDDEALELIMRPEKRIEVTHTAQSAVTNPLFKSLQVQIKSVVDGTIFDQLHPNCLVFSDSGRMFVGDSRGQISVWDVQLRYGKLITENYFKITHMELDGD